MCWETHLPVLYHEVISGLQPRAGGLYVDGTIGPGGHSIGLLEAANPDGQLLALDLDPDALELAGTRLSRFGDRVTMIHSSYTEMVYLVRDLGWGQVDGILLDLGLSSYQLSRSQRGFSFMREGPLDMRFDPMNPVTADQIVNSFPVQELADLLRGLGEEHRGRRIAEEIASSRPISTTSQLAGIVTRAVGGRRGRTHPATRTFQALRIAVNDELEALGAVLPRAIDLLAPGGRLAVISFHSLEDRLVKKTFRRESKNCLCPIEQPTCTCDHKASIREITRRAVVPSDTEVRRNRRSRTAKLRIAEKV